MSQNSRRHFFKLIGISGLALIVPKALFAEERRRAAAPAAGGAGGDLALPFVVPGQGMAANLNFQNKELYEINFSEYYILLLRFNCRCPAFYDVKRSGGNRD